jgi:hypothetical protein
MEFSTFYRSLRFITIFGRSRHGSALVSRWIRSRPSYTVSLRSFLMLSSHIRLGLPNRLFILGFLSKTLFAHLISFVLATCSAHHNLFDLIIPIIADEKCITAYTDLLEGWPVCKYSHVSLLFFRDSPYCEFVELRKFLVVVGLCMTRAGGSEICICCWIWPCDLHNWNRKFCAASRNVWHVTVIVK